MNEPDRPTLPDADDWFAEPEPARPAVNAPLSHFDLDAPREHTASAVGDWFASEPVPAKGPGRDRPLANRPILVAAGIVLALLLVGLALGAVFSGGKKHRSEPPTKQAAPPTTGQKATLRLTAPPATVGLGDRGRSVKKLQRALEALGYSVGTIDGVFGAATQRALVAFQALHHLRPDGVLGRATRAALLKALRRLASPAAAAAHVPAVRGERHLARVDRFSPCLVRVRRPGSYGWPVKPFDQAHPVRGNFGDPRTDFFGGLRGGPNAAGVFRFHNGVDISAPDGTPVYPVESGLVTAVAADHVAVRSADGRHFQYWHIRPSVEPGELVTVDETLLGRILPNLGHVHLSEIDRMRVTNPLAPGHLYPYRDDKPPRVDSVAFAERGRDLSPQALHGTVAITAAAHDDPSPRPPGHWANAVVTPATMTWSLSQKGSIAGVPQTIFDVRKALPPTRDFWKVYAPGTFQNFPISEFRHLTATGTYVFHITELATRRLANGDYTLTIEAGDVCGNTGSLTVPISIEN